MKAIQVKQTGGPDALQYVEIEEPSPGDHEVLVENKAMGINFIDIYHRTGLYPKDLPFVPGVEAAGIVKSTGKNVTQWQAGDHVAYTGVPGTYAEYTIAPENKLVKLPENINHESAAAIMLQGMTAHYLSRSTYPLKKGDTCLIHAAAGGVGLLLVQMAKISDAFIIGTVSTQEKAEKVLSAGADEIIIYTEKDFEEEVKRITNEKGVDVVYDSVGKDTFDKSLNILKQLGFMVLFGQSSGPVPKFDPTILNNKGSLFLTRPSLFHYISSREQLDARAQDLFQWINEGRLKVKIHEKIPLKEASEAHKLLESRKTSGKLILVP